MQGESVWLAPIFTTSVAVVFLVLISLAIGLTCLCYSDCFVAESDRKVAAMDEEVSLLDLEGRPLLTWDDSEKKDFGGTWKAAHD
eukprot:scaffold2737_cov229-Pinguiococcus_pyrenoidosus.AAC.8